MKFRTKYEPGDFCDNEVYEAGTSMTEPGQAESMEHLYKRMSQAELVGRLHASKRITGDATSLQDDVIDQLMSDADLDEYETERTGMAEIVEISVGNQGQILSTQGVSESPNVAKASDEVVVNNLSDDSQELPQK